MANIVVAKFTNDTLLRNKKFRDKTGVGCIYGAPITMNQFKMNEVVFVVEMNLTDNRVEGIGLVLNIVKTGIQYEIYDDYNYNRYIYCGKYRLDRTDIEGLMSKGLTPLPGEPITEPVDVPVLEILDKALFKGKSHMKRGSYLSRITDKLLFRVGTSCNKLQEAIIQRFVDKFEINIVMDEEINYELYGL